MMLENYEGEKIDKMSVKKIGIVIYGTCKHKDHFWEAWLDSAKELIRTIGYVPTHAGITGTSYPAKLRTLARSEQKMRNVIAGGEPVSSLSVYSLPKNFHTANDNHCWLTISNSRYSHPANAYCEMNFDECGKELIETIKNTLLIFMEMEQCEIFTMDKDRVPFNYVFKGMGNEIDKYPTLELLYRS